MNKGWIVEYDLAKGLAETAKFFIESARKRQPHDLLMNEEDTI